MAKDKSKVHQEDAAGQEEVTYEEEVGGSVEEGQSGQGFFEKYRNLILIVAAAAVGAVAFFVYSSGKKDEQNKEAIAEMAMAELNYHQDSIRLALNGGPQSMGFQTLADDYSGTDAGNIALYYLGCGELEQGNIDAGIEHLESFEKGLNMVSAAAYAALGYAYEQKQDYNEAAAQYKKAANTPEENAFTTPFYLLHAARNLETAGDTEAALSTYKKVKEEYAQYEEVRNGNVDKYIAKLSPGDA